MNVKTSVYDIIRSPVLTEKAHALAEAKKCIVLKVLKSANKHQIAKAVEIAFDVKVEKVNTVLTKGKTKSFGGRQGTKSDVKKAYVTLKEGFDINLMNQ